MNGQGYRGAKCVEGGQAWLPALRRYLAFIAVGNLTWEIAQLPLYRIWTEGHAGQIAFAVAHCTAGDVLIATATLILALLLVGSGWPMQPRAYRIVTMLTLVFGVVYTVNSEWLNATVRKTWEYSELMPTLPPLDVGLSPIAQWIVIPVIGFWWARRFVSARVSAQGVA